LSTVRIYKVAELLGTTSQEVMALLKRDHGIEVKSASSTIEEVVGRQFVDRLARQRGITLPSGDLFAEGAAARPAPKKPTLAKKGAPEPAKAAAPTLGPPRLVKAAKAIHEAERAAAAADALAELPIDEDIEPFQPESAEAVAEPDIPNEPVVEAPFAETEPEPVQAEAESIEPAGAEPEIAARTENPAALAPATAAPARVVGSKLRLRVEEGGVTTGPSLPPVAPRRPIVQPPAQAKPAAPGAKPGIMGPAARTGTPTVAPPRPGTLPPRPGGPAGPRPSYSPAPLGGPRPLPSQPVRTQTPGQPGYGARPGMPPRPGMPGQRPGGPGQPGGYRPPQYHRPGGSSSGRRTSSRPTDRSSMPAPIAAPPITKAITLGEGMTVKDLADKLEAKVKDVLKKLLEKGKMMTINSTLDSESATAIAREFGADVQMRTFEEEMVDVEAGDSKAEDVVARAPVVTVMGHVDHGKTTLLDAIRETKVAEREAGGITQHIGAYHVTVGDRNIVFLDTPGHEAFTMMRSRGAKVTDVVVLVVAADDGVMPQTREAINHAKAANVPIVVAVNKIDKPGANPDNVKRELADLGLMPEAWGGTTVTVDVSAKKRQNLDLLLEMILLSSDILELKANPQKGAMGTVLEAKLDRGRGPVATILVQDGTL
jgi:translation initiation factor IF-2